MKPFDFRVLLYRKPALFYRYRLNAFIIMIGLSVKTFPSFQ